MKQSITLRWRTLGLAVAVALAFLLAITPDNPAGGLARGGAGLPDGMPADGFAIPATTLAGWLADGTALSLIDVRERHEFDEFHLPGAVHLAPGSSLAPEVFAAWPVDPVVVVARNDVAAGYVVAALRLAGRDAWALGGGLTAWWDEVLRPASLDVSIPREALPAEAARRAAWRSHFLGTAADSGAHLAVTPAAPTAPAPAAPVHGKSKAKRGKGC